MTTRRFLLLFSLVTFAVVAIFIVEANSSLFRSSGETEALDTSPVLVDTTIVDSVINEMTALESSIDANATFAQPLHGDLTLSGTFGELRSNHFHAGLDIRTGGSEGKAVLAAADGYINRIKVSPWGYGKALYIAHPNGKTTVYGHLKKFNGAIQTAIVARQYAQKSFETEWYPEAGKLKVKQGDTIAWSGNTGGSGGPHLHFEIRDSRTSETLNPLLFGINIKDTLNPVIRRMHVFDLGREARTREGHLPRRSIENNQKELRLAPGTYGFGAEWVDYFVDYQSKLGINLAELSYDGQRSFSQKIESFRFDEGRMINMHIDYPYYKEHSKRIVKLFKDEGNLLRFYEAKSRGHLDLKPGDSILLELKVTDLSSHHRVRKLLVICDDELVPIKPKSIDLGTDSFLIQKGKRQQFSTPYLRLELAPDLTYYSSWIGAARIDKESDLGPMVRIHKDIVPLRKSMSFGLKINDDYKGDLNKIVVMEYDPKSRSSSFAGNERRGKWVYAKSKTFGMYYLKVDSTSPRVELQKAARNFRIKISDNMSGIDSYKVTIDGSWVLAEYEPKRARLFGTIPESVENGKHKMKVTVVDNAGNIKIIQKEINLQ